MWYRLWCGTYVLQEVGYEEEARAKQVPSCLAWRTTKWQPLGKWKLLNGLVLLDFWASMPVCSCARRISVWQRVDPK